MKPINQSQRISYVDNLRIFLIILVVLHHLAITYGAPGGWYYVENNADSLSILPLAIFVATNQSFFMGLFFFIAAYFSVGSLDRKGSKLFLRDRFIRLGIPLLFYFFVLSPLTIYLLVQQDNEVTTSFFEFLFAGRGWGFGPMWFVEALLYFTILYLGYRYLRKPVQSQTAVHLGFPANWMIILFVLFLALITFLIRIWLPVGWVLDPLGFQFPHFPQYISLFILGIIAFRNNWLSSITYKAGMRWFLVAQALIFIVFPALFILGGATSGNTEPFMGGLHWQSFCYAIWEQFVGFSLIIGLIGIFKKNMNTTSRWTRTMSTAAYGVYIVHPPILVFIGMSMRQLEIYPVLKLIILAPFVVVCCFIVAILIRKIPYVSKVI
jgi:peptidoglycan/LPS O-acetylase OafA/YrhL